MNCQVPAASVSWKRRKGQRGGLLQQVRERNNLMSLKSTVTQLKPAAISYGSWKVIPRAIKRAASEHSDTPMAVHCPYFTDMFSVRNSRPWHGRLKREAALPDP